MNIFTRIKQTRFGNVFKFWSIITVFNIVVGLTIAAIRISYTDSVTIQSPAFVQIAQQSILVHNQLRQAIKDNTDRVEIVSKKTEEIEQRVNTLERTK